MKRLSMSTWIRQQKWLHLCYRRLPQRWRDAVSESVVRRLCKPLRFVRTPAWNKSSPVVLNRMGSKHEVMRLWPVTNMLGVNILGYVRGQFGLGEAARAYARVLIDAGVPVSLYDLDLNLPHGWNDRSLDAWISDDLRHPVSIVFVNPDYWQMAMEKIRHARVKGQRLIACWFWELERIPDSWIACIDEVDEIMVATEFIAKAFREVTDKPVVKVPYPLGAIPDSGLQRLDFGLEQGKYIFLTSFDFNSYMLRKNPMAVIDAFMAAFPSDRDDVRLLVKSINGFRDPVKLRVLLAAAGKDPRIMVRDDLIDRAHVNALQRCCDAYVSLHHAEGLGLGLAECMSLGKPVIATAWSGNMEFMDESNSCLVGYRLVELREGDYQAFEGQCWAEADVMEAATWMRRLADDSVFSEKIGSRARDSVAETLSSQKAFESLAQHLLKSCVLPSAHVGSHNEISGVQ